jgi:hypothetical protein
VILGQVAIAMDDSPSENGVRDEHRARADAGAIASIYNEEIVGREVT